MKMIVLAIACLEALSATAMACTSNTQLISTSEVSRMDIHRGGAGAPATGPTEGEYVTWFSSFGQIKRVYKTTYTLERADRSCPVPTTTNTYSDELLYNMCPTCGTNAGYEVKIFSKQDPRVEKFDKPVMIVPGFDPDYGSTTPSNTFENFEAMMSTVFDETKSGSIVVESQNYLKDLYDAGYDIVFILFYSPNIDIYTNAQVLEKAMVWLNSKSSTRPGDAPAILGASMGGLIARQMLQNAGKNQGPNGGAIKAGLFIAFDVPNRGAEIPVSIQATARYLASEAGSVEILNSNIGSSSAQQMLLAFRGSNIDKNQYPWITDYEAPGSIHGDFMRSINDPANRAAIKNIRTNNNTRAIRTIAITSGSNRGIAAQRGLPAGIVYLHEEYAALDYAMSFSDENKNTRVLDIDAANKPEWWHHLREPVFIENLPGGNRNSYSQLSRTLSIAKWGAHTSHDLTGTFPGHCFIPTASAMGLTGFNINSTAGWLSTSGTSMFDEVFAPDLNQNHVAITMQNKEWITSALRRFGPGSSNVVATIILPLLLQ
jgi:hypothetical protein